MSKDNSSFFDNFGAARKQYELDNDSQGDFLLRNSLEKEYGKDPFDDDENRCSGDESYDIGYQDAYEEAYEEGYEDARRIYDND